MNRIPLFPLGLVLLPGMPLPLHIFEERYKQMITECLDESVPFGIVWFDGQSIRSVGCTARVINVLHRYEDGRMDILTRGERRFFTEALVEEKPYIEADVHFIEDVEQTDDSESFEAARALLAKLSDAGHLSEPIAALAVESAQQLSFAIPAFEGFTHAERQRFLEMTSRSERLQKGMQALAGILERAQVTKLVQKIIGGNGHPPKEALQKLSAEDTASED
ncbi:MAG: LON peptidase substrate-binding domain-containing protein [Desulfobacterales bacterium]|nr:LON peptidase substrate-binding domain-containing protein [Desulfobacterales bacterium]